MSTRRSRLLDCCALLVAFCLTSAEPSAAAVEPERTLRSLCRSTNKSGRTADIQLADLTERACLEHALGKQRQQAQVRLAAFAKKAKGLKVALFRSQEADWNALNELMCGLDEDLFWIIFGGRWRSDGTMRGTLYSKCIAGELRNQIYFWQTLTRGSAPGLRTLALDVASHAPYVRGMLADVEKAANDALAQKLPPGRGGQFFTGSPMGPHDWLELSVTTKRARALAARLGVGACAAWPELAQSFEGEQSCQTVMGDYYVAVTGLLDFDKPFERISP